jgi:hypothetical protein
MNTMEKNPKRAEILPWRAWRTWRKDIFGAKPPPMLSMISMEKNPKKKKSLTMESMAVHGEKMVLGEAPPCSPCAPW